MGTAGRPTLRCLREDLAGSVQDTYQQGRIRAGKVPCAALTDTKHPLVDWVAHQFEVGDDADISRTGISAIKHPKFYKARTGKRWRGAVYVDPATGQAWLVAAGYRREGEPDDFYTQFAADVNANGADRYLPSEDDLAVLRVEEAKARLADWKTDVAVAVFETVAEAIESPEGKASVMLPGLDIEGNVGQLSLELTSDPDLGVDEQGDTLVEVDIAIHDWSDIEAERLLTVTVCSAMAPSEDSWDAVPMHGLTHLIAQIPSARLADIRQSVALGDLPTEPPGEVRQTDHSHFVAARNIARATVNGEAVVAICGATFVPRRDPTGLDVCPTCTDIQRAAAGSD
jgi:hypothetical protein